MKCPICGEEVSIKENDRFSSLLCGCRIVIYYYDSGNHIVVTKEEYLEYKKKQYEEREKGITKQ